MKSAIKFQIGFCIVMHLFCLKANSQTPDRGEATSYFVNVLTKMQNLFHDTKGLFQISCIQMYYLDNEASLKQKYQFRKNQKYTLSVATRNGVDLIMVQDINGKEVSTMAKSKGNTLTHEFVYFDDRTGELEITAMVYDESSKEYVLATGIPIVLMILEHVGK